MLVILITVVLGSGIAFWTQQTGLYKGATSSTGGITAIFCEAYTTAGACSAVPGCTWQLPLSSPYGRCIPTPGSPDLRIQNIAITPNNPQIDQNISFTATVINDGAANVVDSFILRLRIDAGNDNSWNVTTDQSISNLNQNASKTVTFTNAWKAAAGTHRYRVCADAGPNISESNEYNNCLVQTIVIAAAPAPQPSPPPPQEEQPQSGPSFDFSELGAAVSCAQQINQAACNLVSGCAWIDGSCRVSSSSPPPQELSPPPPAEIPPPEPAALYISASLPQNQTTILNAGIQFVKAISIDLAKTGGNDAADAISGITLNLSGNFPKSKLREEELWVKGDIEEKVTAATITKNPTKDALIIALPSNYLLGANKKFILYVKAEVAEVDTSKTFQYIVSGATTIPASITKTFADGSQAAGPEFTIAEMAGEELTCANGKIEQGGQCVCPAGTNEFSGGVTFYTPNVCIPCTSAQLIASGGFYCPQDRPAPPPAPELAEPAPQPLASAALPQEPVAEETGSQACAAQGKYVYTGPAKPGVRTPGMCIDCPTETYIKFGGKCEARKTAARTAQPKIESPQATGAVSEQPSGPQTQTGSRGVAYAPGPQPSLQGSQRLVRAPERGQVGPGVAVYFGVLAAIQGGIWLKRRFWKK